MRQAVILTLRLSLALMMVTASHATIPPPGGTLPITCPNKALTSTTSNFGQHLRVTVKVTNVGDRDIIDAVFKLGLPRTGIDVNTAKASAFPSSRGMQKVTLPSSIYWLHVNIPIKRSRKFTFKAKTTVCSATVLSFEALTYQVTPGNGMPSCPVSTRPIQVALKPKSSFLGKKKCPTPAPTPTPTGPFYPYADNQRCLEGELALQSIDSAEACWSYCSLYGDTPAPFYFDFSSAADECYCSGATCTLFYDPGFTAYIAAALATSAPTRSPTTAPTPAFQIIEYAENCGCLEDLPLNFTATRQLLYGTEKRGESESTYMGAVRLKLPKEEGEKEYRNALLPGAPGDEKSSVTAYDKIFNRLDDKPPESEEAAHSHMAPRHLSINPNATRIYNVTKDECAIYCAQQSPPPTFFAYTDDNNGFTSCACPGAKCTIVFGVPDTNVYSIVPVEPVTSSPTMAPTRVGDTGAPSPAPTVPCCPVAPPTAAPTTTYPFFRALPVTTLNNAAVPPPDTWAINPESFDSAQSIAPAPGEPTCALRQETFNNLADNSSKATAGVYYDPQGLFNGMLFKDFVLNGFKLTYNYYVDSSGRPNIAAPDIRFKTMSSSTGRQSDFIWNPSNNQGSQGPVAYQAWATDTIDETTGSNSSWPVGSTGGEGWSCTLGCYMPVNSTGNLAYPPTMAASTFRNLETYVEGLLDQGQCSSPACAMGDAVITGIQVVLGPNEPSTVAFSQNVTVASGGYSWRWRFLC